MSSRSSSAADGSRVASTASTRRAVLLGQPEELIAAALDLRQPLGVLLHLRRRTPRPGGPARQVGVGGVEHLPPAGRPRGRPSPAPPAPGRPRQRRRARCRSSPSSASAIRWACSASAPAWLSRRASTWSASSSPGLSRARVDLVHHVPQVVGPAAHLVAPRGQRRLLGPERVQRARAPRPRPRARPRRARTRRGCRAGPRRGAATGSRAGRGDPPGARRARRAPWRSWGCR